MLLKIIDIGKEMKWLLTTVFRVGGLFPVTERSTDKLTWQWKKTKSYLNKNILKFL